MKTPHPAAAVSRRALISRCFAASAMCAATTLPNAAVAIDLTLPKFEDLRAKWESVGLGLAPGLVVQLMGSPNGRTETQTMGVPHLALEWKDIKGNQYTAKFLAGRLYAKKVTDTR